MAKLTVLFIYLFIYLGFGELRSTRDNDLHSRRWLWKVEFSFKLADIRIYCFFCCCYYHIYYSTLNTRDFEYTTCEPSRAVPLFYTELAPRVAVFNFELSHQPWSGCAGRLVSKGLACKTYSFATVFSMT